MTPAEKLLQAMEEIEEKYTELVEGFEWDNFGEDTDEVRKLFLELEGKIRPMFEKMSGFSMTTKEYMLAAEKHRRLLRPILDRYSDWNKEIKLGYGFYT